MKILDCLYFKDILLISNCLPAALLKFFPLQKGVEGGVPPWELRHHVYISKSKLKPLEFVSSWEKHTFRNYTIGIGYLEL